MPVIEILKGGKVVNAILADAEFAEAQHPGAWRMAAVQPDPTEPSEPEWAWYIDPESFTDRLGSAVTMVLDTSSDTSFVAIRADFARRRWIDLKDARVIATVRYLAGHPMPGLPTLAEPLLTAAQADSILNTPVNEWENLVLRKLYFS